MFVPKSNRTFLLQNQCSRCALSFPFPTYALTTIWCFLSAAEYLVWHEVHQSATSRLKPSDYWNMDWTLPTKLATHCTFILFAGKKSSPLPASGVFVVSVNCYSFEKSKHW
ncbi:hypothetical protein M758_4G224500 [Ceratodon purpureus]|uniref:Uncharacterized protein n=1 Tax=Ceratodon purpureus TaxID=3225 RepID=A0A8T0IDP7_CERPU|nr:hypothetical protein KC19_4G220000 [Ceratodon purpureus]KAG0620548.1 hypothetical protein M758_4G224500 [Ceratodon purpureus]